MVYILSFASVVAGVFAVTIIATSVREKIRNGHWNSIIFVGVILLVIPLFTGWMALRSIHVQQEIRVIEESGDYYTAYQMYLECQIQYGDFGGVDIAIQRVEKPAKYALATKMYKNQEYLSALKIFLELGSYGNSRTCAENCMRAYLESR